MTEIAEKPTRTHDLHTYKVLSPDWLTEHEPRVLEHMVTHPDGTYEMSVMSEIGDGVYIAWSSCRRCSKQYVVCSCKEGPLEPEHITKARAARWAGSFDTRPDLGVDREVIRKVVTELRDRGYVVGEIPDPIVKEVEVKVADHSLFVELFKEVGACEPEEGTQLDDVLEQFQERYDEITGHRAQGDAEDVAAMDSIIALEDLAIEDLTEQEADDFDEAIQDLRRPTVEDAQVAAQVQTAIDPESTIQDDVVVEPGQPAETVETGGSAEPEPETAEQRAQRKLDEISVDF